MPFDYSIKGWLSTVTIDNNTYAVTSCDKDDSGLVYAIANQGNPHITIHNLKKEGPDDWRRSGGVFHVRMSNTKIYEYDRTGPADFVHAGGKKKGEKATGCGTADQTSAANKIADEFRNAIDASLR
jgi:hypothetical protein